MTCEFSFSPKRLALTQTVILNRIEHRVQKESYFRLLQLSSLLAGWESSMGRLLSSDNAFSGLINLDTSLRLPYFTAPRTEERSSREMTQVWTDAKIRSCLFAWNSFGAAQVYKP
jgi:hypothetical protein